MLNLAVPFFVIAIVAAVLGFTRIAGSAIDIAKDELVDEISRGKGKHLKIFKKGHQKIKNLIKRLGSRF